MALAALTLFATGLTLSFAGSAQAAAVAVPLGTASNYAVLAGSTVTNAGSTVITGDVGLSPGTSITGFPPGHVNGTTDASDPAAVVAQTDLTVGYDAAAAEGPTQPVTADLGGQTLVAGVYNSATGLGLTGALTLDGQGDPNSVWVFQAGSTLTTAAASSINLINGADACNVYWQVGSSATLGVGSTFDGSILALQSVTVTTDVTIHGRALARNGAVTLDTDSITVSTCAAPPPPVVSASASATSSATGSPSTSPTTSTSTSASTSTTPSISASSSPTKSATKSPSKHPKHPKHSASAAPTTPHGNGGGGGQVGIVPGGAPDTGDGGSIHAANPFLIGAGAVALLASAAAFLLWRREHTEA